MSLLAEFEAASPRLFLGPTLETYPTLEVDLERQFAIDPDRPIAFCWTRGLSRDRLETALDRDDTIDAAERLETDDDRSLYRLRRSRTNVVGAYREWVSVGAELLDGNGIGGGWAVCMRFPDRDAFATYHEFLDENGVSFDLQRLSTGARSNTDDDRLTASQREAIRAAYEGGFFDVPRGATLGDLSSDLEISDQAMSERLRRGQARLVEQYVL